MFCQRGEISPNLVTLTFTETSSSLEEKFSPVLFKREGPSWPSVDGGMGVECQRTKAVG